MLIRRTALVGVFFLLTSVSLAASPAAKQETRQAPVASEKKAPKGAPFPGTPLSPGEINSRLAAASSWHQGYTLVVLNSADAAAAHRLRESIVAQGGRIAIMAGPHILLGWIPADVAARWKNRNEIELITTDPVDPSEIGYDDEQTVAALKFYNSVVSGEAQRDLVQAVQQIGTPLNNDVKSSPQIDRAAYEDNLRSLGISASTGNSDNMTGTVSVCLFFVESDGSV